MKTNRFKYILTAIALLCLCCFFTNLFACTPAEEDDIDESVTVGSIILDKETITLEKRESYALTVTLKEIQGEITWASSDSEVVTVSTNGLLTAIKAGQAVITASIEEVKTECYVTVEDNNQNIVILTNLSNQQNIVCLDQKSVSVNVYYNNKELTNATVNFSVVGEDNVISLKDGVITANNVGAVQFVISASWQDLEYKKIIEVNVVPNMTAKMATVNFATLKTVGSAHETSLQLDFLVYENGKKLSPEEYTVEYADFNDKVVKIDDGVIFAEGKGEVNISATVTSNVTGNSVITNLPVSVVLVNQDKTSSIKIKDLAWDDNEYTLSLAEVFSDVDDTRLEGCNIISITDVTDVEYLVPYANGKVNIDFLEENKILGDRVWRVECEKFSYDVSIYIEKINTDALVVSMAGTYLPVANGVYNFKDWEKIIVGATGTIRAYGNASHTLKVEPIDSNYGTIKDGTRSEIVNGYYVKDGENFNLFIYSTDNSYRHTVQFCKDGVTPINENAIYEKLAGTYTDAQNNTLTLTSENVGGSEKSSLAGNAKKCSGKIDNYNIQPTYDIIVTSANSGIIYITSNNGSFLNHTATYVIEDGVVTISVKYGNGLVFTKN